jgi:hypothetical protein
MQDRERSILEAVDYRIAVSRFESAFAACERLDLDDRHLLLREIATRLIQRLPSEPLGERLPPKVAEIEYSHS